MAVLVALVLLSALCLVSVHAESKKCESDDRLYASWCSMHALWQACRDVGKWRNHTQVTTCWLHNEGKRRRFSATTTPPPRQASRAFWALRSSRTLWAAGKCVLYFPIPLLTNFFHSVSRPSRYVQKGRQGQRQMRLRLHEHTKIRTLRHRAHVPSGNRRPQDCLPVEQPSSQVRSSHL